MSGTRLSRGCSVDTSELLAQRDSRVRPIEQGERDQFFVTSILKQIPPHFADDPRFAISDGKTNLQNQVYYSMGEHRAIEQPNQQILHTEDGVDVEAQVPQIRGDCMTPNCPGPVRPSEAIQLCPGRARRTLHR